MQRRPADRAGVNTVAASIRRVPRAATVGLLALVLAFAALMVVRAGVLNSTSTPPSSAPPGQRLRTTPRTPARPAQPKLALLAGLPQPVARALRYSNVLVVSLYTPTVPGDRAAVSQAQTGARAAGAGFVAMNVLDNLRATELAGFVGPITTPALLVVRRPGSIVMRMEGSVESVLVSQAARNAGARRR